MDAASRVSGNDASSRLQESSFDDKMEDSKAGKSKQGDGGQNSSANTSANESGAPSKDSTKASEAPKAAAPEMSEANASATEAAAPAIDAPKTGSKVEAPKAGAPEMKDVPSDVSRSQVENRAANDAGDAGNRAEGTDAPQNTGRGSETAIASQRTGQIATEEALASERAGQAASEEPVNGTDAPTANNSGIALDSAAEPVLVGDAAAAIDGPRDAVSGEQAISEAFEARGISTNDFTEESKRVISENGQTIDQVLDGGAANVDEVSAIANENKNLNFETRDEIMTDDDQELAGISTEDGQQLLSKKLDASPELARQAGSHEIGEATYQQIAKIEARAGNEAFASQSPSAGDFGEGVASRAIGGAFGEELTATTAAGQTDNVTLAGGISGQAANLEVTVGNQTRSQAVPGGRRLGNNARRNIALAIKTIVKQLTDAFTDPLDRPITTKSDRLAIRDYNAANAEAQKLREAGQDGVREASQDRGYWDKYGELFNRSVNQGGGWNGYRGAYQGRDGTRYRPFAKYSPTAGANLKGRGNGYVNNKDRPIFPAGGGGSDRRIKQEIAVVGHLADLGIDIYTWRYRNDDTTRYVGVMAQDLLRDPALAHAVRIADAGEFAGYYEVDYTVLGLQMNTEEAWHHGGLSSVTAAIAA